MFDQTGRLDISDRPQRPVLTASPGQKQKAGRFFQEGLSLRPGWYAARVQVMFAEACHGETIRIVVRTMLDAITLAQAELAADPANRASGDEIHLSFHVPLAADLEGRGALIEIAGSIDDNYATTLLRHITVLPQADRGWTPSDFHFVQPEGPTLAAMEAVFLGTTGRCNASCIHCPTNKPGRGGSNGVMSADLFHKIVDELVEGQFHGTIMLGLFGEPLNDPFIMDRLRTIKHRLPTCKLSLSTNCGAFDLGKHGDILEFIDVVAVHVESGDPAVYDHMMTPLTAERVFPRIDQLLALNDRTRNRAIAITSPLHKANLGTINTIRERFGGSGRIHVNVSAVSSRCWDDGIFRQLSLAPVASACKPSLLRQLAMIDWDGALLPCCSDFSKSLPLGNLSRQSFREIFASEAWRSLSETLRRGEWSSRGACSRCRQDHEATIKRLAHDVSVAAHPAVATYPASSFSLAQANREDDGTVLIDDTCPDGVAIYGPYVGIPRGRYRITFSIRAATPAAGLLVADITLGYCRTIASLTVALEDGQTPCGLDFLQDSDDVVEFRISKTGPVAFRFNGAVLTRLGD